jgi:peptide synthetase xpsA
VREAVVLAREDGAGDRRLVAYVTARADGTSAGDAVQALDVDVLREQLKAVLPGYMVPSAFVVLKEMPLTPNGKVDRKALPAPDPSALQTRAYEAPQTPTEEALASIWQELLGVERVGRNDNFFDLGGHSLLLVQLAARLKDQFDMDMELIHIFNAATLRDLASLVLEMGINEFQASDIQKMEEELDGMTEEELLALLDEE